MTMEFRYKQEHTDVGERLEAQVIFMFETINGLGMGVFSL